jgi:hypothetical protein
MPGFGGRYDVSQPPEEDGCRSGGVEEEPIESFGDDAGGGSEAVGPRRVLGRYREGG